MTEAGANEELFSLIIVSRFIFWLKILKYYIISILFLNIKFLTHHFILIIGLIARLGRQNAKRMRRILYKTIRVRSDK